MKDRADCFDAMVEHEEKIRLDQAGWKERYYQVGRPGPVGGLGRKPANGRSSASVIGAA